MNPYPKLEKEMFSSKLFRSHFIPEQGHLGFIFSGVRYPLSCIYRKYLCLFWGVNVLLPGESGRICQGGSVFKKSCLQWKKILVFSFKITPLKTNMIMENHYLKMYFLLNMRIFQCRVMFVFRGVCFESLRLKTSELISRSLVNSMPWCSQPRNRWSLGSPTQEGGRGWFFADGLG